MPDDSLRASHEDRDRVADVLREAAGDGRLTSDELDERLERALTARTYGELAALTADLPAGQAAPLPEPKDVLRIERYGVNERRDGNWVVPARIDLLVTAGSVTLDFTEAVITLPSLQINAMVTGGNLTLITKPDVVVDTDEVAMVGGRVIARQPPGHPAHAVLRVTLSGRIIGGNIRVRPPRPPRRRFRQRFRQERS